MTQTKIKGWCAWREDRGFVPETFVEFEVVYFSSWGKLISYLGDLHFSVHACALDIVRTRMEDLKSQGWEVRECYLTIEDV